MHKQAALLVSLLVLLACPGEGTEPEVFSGFSGTWTGGESNGATSSGTIRFTVTGTTVTGDVSPISGSARALTGIVSSSGALTANLAAGSNNACAVTLAGQITSAVDGSGTASGTYALVSSPTCNTNSGTWTATKPAGP